MKSDDRYDLRCAIDALESWRAVGADRGYEFGPTSDQHNRGYYAVKLTRNGVGAIRILETNPRHAVNAALAGEVK